MLSKIRGLWRNIFLASRLWRCRARLVPRPLHWMERTMGCCWTSSDFLCSFTLALYKIAAPIRKQMKCYSLVLCVFLLLPPLAEENDVWWRHCSRSCALLRSVSYSLAFALEGSPGTSLIWWLTDWTHSILRPFLDMGRFPFSPPKKMEIPGRTALKCATRLGVVLKCRKFQPFILLYFFFLEGEGGG